MRRFFVSALGCAVMLMATGIQALGPVAAPVDRAAGNGSMGMGDGIGYPPESRDNERTEVQDRKDRRDVRVEPGTEPGHGGNETNMEHRRRPTLGDD